MCQKGIQKPSKTKRGQKPLTIFKKRCQKPIQFQKGIKKLSNISSKSCQKYIKFSVFTDATNHIGPCNKLDSSQIVTRLFSCSTLSDTFLWAFQRRNQPLFSNCLAYCLGPSREGTYFYLRTVRHFAQGLLEKKLTSI